MSTAPFRAWAVAATILLAAVLWFVTFYVTWSIFWIKISFSAAALASLAIGLQPDSLKRLKFCARDFIAGVLSAALLYIIFWVAKKVSSNLLPLAEHQIGTIYDKGAGTPIWLIAFLLFFVTGPSEEIYWRGYLQHSLMKRFGGYPGWLLATAAYAGVHIWSFNIMLIGAAAVAGAFWGFMYWRLKNLAPVIVSHSMWSTFIFAVVPLG